MMKKVKQQKGQIFRAGKSWYGRWRRDELETIADGSKVVVRRQHARNFASMATVTARSGMSNLCSMGNFDR